MLCAILVASSAAGLPALRDLSVRERASGELKRPAGGPQKGLSAVAPGGNGTSQGAEPGGAAASADTLLYRLKYASFGDGLHRVLTRCLR